MNKKALVTLGVIGGSLAAAWYFLIPPAIKIIQIDQLGKKVRFTYNGKEQVFDYSNPALSMGLPVVRVFNTTVTFMPGTQPILHFKTYRGTRVVAQQQILLNKSVTA